MQVYINGIIKQVYSQQFAFIGAHDCFAVIDLSSAADEKVIIDEK